MKLLKLWKYIVEHNVWSKVAGGIFTAAGLAVFALIYSIVTDKKFISIFLSFFTLQMPVWLYLCITILVAFVVQASKKRNRPSRVVEASELKSRLEPAAPFTPIILAPNSNDHLIFESNKSDDKSYVGYGQKLWNNNERTFYGNSGEGSMQFRDGIISVLRANVDGRFIVEIKDYYLRKSSFVQANITGKNPRNFRIMFTERVLSGQVKAIFVFKKKGTHEWINQYEYEFKNPEWQGQVVSLAVGAHLDFVIEMHSSIIGNTIGILQMTDIKIEEI